MRAADKSKEERAIKSICFSNRGRWALFFSALIFVFFSLPLAADGGIPLLICEHHADHMEFFFRYGEQSSAAMIVLDAHADTVINERSEERRVGKECRP
jgi:hypothetical protein